MQYVKRYYDPVLLALLNMLGIASAMGFLLCMAILLHGHTNFVQTDVALYLVWFVVSLLSVTVMKRGDIWGAYALGIATVAITLYDLARDMASLGGATLGIWVMIIVIGYITTATPIQEDGLTTDAL